MHGTTQGEVGLDIPLKGTKFWSSAGKALLQLFMLIDRVEDHEPVSWRCLGVGAIGPELSQHSGVVS